MSKLLRAYERTILFGMLQNKIVFTVPILTSGGVEYRITCTVLETQPNAMTYTVLKIPEPVERLPVNPDGTPRSYRYCAPVHEQCGELR